MTEQNQNNHNTEHHVGPHVPGVQGENVWGPISNTTITSLIFLFIVIIFCAFANLVLKKPQSRLKEGILNLISLLDNLLKESFQNEKFARGHFTLIAGFFIIILGGNFLGLIIDWLSLTFGGIFEIYMRPMFSDLNNTLVLAVITVVMFLLIAIKYQGGFHVAKGYFFNWTGNGITEKCINVFVGWIHFISVFSTLASLSLRLYGNIFAGVVLIGVMSYLGVLMSSNVFEIGRFITLPFWFFEIFVAVVQSIVFAGLMIAYFSQNKNPTH